MQKKTINMQSQATSVKGQGVGSAYMEQVKLVKEGLSDKFEIYENAHIAADITHYHTFNPTYFLLKNWRCRKGTSVCYVHTLPETMDKSVKLPKWARKIFYAYMIKFYKIMEHLVVVNPYFIDALENYGIKREKVTYIPNFVDTERFHPISAEEKSAARKKFGLPEDKFTVLCAGQLQVRKGAFDFLKCAELLPDVQFVWAGGFSFGLISDGYKELSRVVEDPPHNVKFLGIVEREDMNLVYNAADVMFLPSYDELFPMTILEAMCVNMPILLRELPIYENILFDFYYGESDVEGFVKAISRLKDDSGYYSKGAENAKRGNGFYEKSNVLKMWDDFYTSVLK
ncbi:MAG: glycosyltransferase family 4 protein [Firmicutes bacterium]|nr:glycosyltransferase family 4 protein [[Eubacterium] siraeum]MCM1488039.1 glycosyltransferase family 4 protein [Bacillota bacterium]